MQTVQDQEHPKDTGVYYRVKVYLQVQHAYCLTQVFGTQQESLLLC